MTPFSKIETGLERARIRQTGWRQVASHARPDSPQAALARAHLDYLDTYIAADTKLLAYLRRRWAVYELFPTAGNPADLQRPFHRLTVQPPPRPLPQLSTRTIYVTIAGVSFGFLGHSGPAGADFLSEPGGSNFVFIGQHEYPPLPLGSAENGNCSAYAMGDARSVIAVYDVAKAAIDAKFRSFYAAGQRKISLVLWHFFNKYSYAPPRTTHLTTYF